MRRLLTLTALTAITALTTQPALAAIPNDPLIEQQWYLAKVQAFNAWDHGTGTDDVVVAVLDTGIDLDHPDIKENLWRNEGEVKGDGIDNDQNGFVDDTNGWDFIDGDNSPTPSAVNAPSDDAVVHGTVIAGVIAAVGNNGEGIAGLNWKAKIMPVRILDQFGSGTSEGARKAIEYAVANHADVINLSFTGFEVDEVFKDVVHRAYQAGVIVVAAVGNKSGGGVNLDETPVYPACFMGLDGDWVLGVAATTRQDTKAGFSNYGSTCTDISAPGIEVFGTSFQDPTVNGFGQAYLGGWAGTSIASPMVAGAAALLKAKYPFITPTQVKTALQLSVDPLAEVGTPAAGKLGAGRLNVARAFEVAGQFTFGTSLPIPSGPAPAVLPPPPTPPPGGGGFESVRIVLAAGPGAAPRVQVFDEGGHASASFLAYAEAFKGGVRVAAGDVDGDGVMEIITVPGPGGGPHVRIFTLSGTVKGQFFAGDKADRRGLNVSVADVDGDLKWEIITSTEVGGLGEVNVFTMDGTRLSSFKPFPGSKEAIRATGVDADGDRRDEIAVALGAGAKPEVRLFSSTGSLKKSFLAYGAGFLGGIYLTAADLDADGSEEIVAGTGTGGGPQVRTFTGKGAVVDSFFAFDATHRKGVMVAGAGTFLVALEGSSGAVKLLNRKGQTMGGFDVLPGNYSLAVLE